MGPKITRSFDARVEFGEFGYEFSLLPTPENHFVFSSEAFFKLADGFEEGSVSGVAGLGEARLMRPFDSLYGPLIYHFHDTSLTASVRRASAINDNEILRPDAGNLAAFLFRIQTTDPDSYLRVRNVIRLAAPFFDDFNLRPVPATPDLIQLEWRQQGSDYPFRAHQFSDGTLRFICLATALLQPNRPVTVLFDEPELGLHPYALTLLGNLLLQATESTGKQVIVSTQSAPLIDEFRPEDVIVVERTNGESTFRRLNAAALSGWLEDYSLGELWQKNVLGGKPQEEWRPSPAGGNGRK
jgi:hypothetical protein